MIFSRDRLLKALGNDHLLVAQFEELDDALTSTTDTANAASQTASSAQTALDQANSSPTQPFSDLLAAIADLDASQTGVIAIVGTDAVAIYPLGSFTRFLGKGTTAGRPATPSVGLYFDTTLAANGKPIFYTGTAWVDSAGTVV